MADKKKTRRWVVRAIVGFLVIMLLLTFFSNTIMNATIPKVVAEHAQWGNLSFSNTQKGTLECTNKTEYKVPKGLAGRKIDKIEYTTFDSIGKNDVIFTLKEVEDTEAYDTKVDDLDELKKKLGYDARAPKDTSTEDNLKDSITTAKDAVDDAAEKYNESKNKDQTISNANQTIQDNSGSLVTAEAEVEAITATVEDYETKISEINTEIAKIDEKITILQTVATPTPTAAPTTDPTSESTDATDETSETTPAETTPAPSVTPVPGSIEDYEAQKATLEEQKKTLETNLADAKARLDAASAEKARLDGVIKEAEDTITSANQLDDEDDAKKELDKANKTLTDAQKSYDNSQINAGIQNDKDADQLAKDLKKIEKMEKEIAEMKEAMETTEIKAPVGGVLYDVSVNEGDELQEGQLLFSVLPDYTDIECTVEFTFTTQAAQGIQVGQELTCETTWIDSVKVLSIKPDKSSPRDYRIVKCSVEAEYLYPGEEVKVTAGKSNQNYDNIVPSSAVIKDNTGYFVYALVEKSTPLGTKYTVKKIDVTVEETDGARTAIKGDGLDSKYQYVTRSEEPLKDGDRVRLQDYSKKE